MAGLQVDLTDYDYVVFDYMATSTASTKSVTFGIVEQLSSTAVTYLKSRSGTIDGKEYAVAIKVSDLVGSHCITTECWVNDNYRANTLYVYNIILIKV